MLKRKILGSSHFKPVKSLDITSRPAHSHIGGVDDLVVPVRCNYTADTHLWTSLLKDTTNNGFQKCSVILPLKNGSLSPVAIDCSLTVKTI